MCNLIPSKLVVIKGHLQARVLRGGLLFKDVMSSILAEILRLGAPEHGTKYILSCFRSVYRLHVLLLTSLIPLTRGAALAPVPSRQFSLWL